MHVGSDPISGVPNGVPLHPTNAVPVRIEFSRVAPPRLVKERFELVKFAPNRFAKDRFATERFA